MPKWSPDPLAWFEADAYIIGGGSSLRAFDWATLVGRNTVGCNAAYALGEDVCKVCLFGDDSFFKHHQDDLAKFKNDVVTCAPSLATSTLPWLKWMPRLPRGLGLTKLGWNFNTGSAAVNLAFLMGATTVYLLGFDMHLDEERRPNWHDHVISPPSDAVYKRFLEGFRYVERDRARYFADRKIINLHDGTSNLGVFPSMSLAQHFERKMS